MPVIAEKQLNSSKKILSISIITDNQMPDTDGLEVARYVYKNCPDTRVIILTGYAEFEYAQTAISYNVSSFIINLWIRKNY